MTLVLGMAHENFLTVIADSEESTPTHKRSVFKIPLTENKEGGTLIVGGAGPDSHIETVTGLLFDEFQSARGKGLRELKARFAEIILGHYKNHVLSWPSVIEREDNDFSLLLGMCVRKKKGQHVLLTSEGGTLRPLITPYHAIGLGASYAKSLLDEYLSLRDPFLTAVTCLYVAYRVKRDTANVGKELTMWAIDDGVVRLIRDDHIEGLEYLFERYDYARVRHFLAIFGTDNFSPVDKRNDAQLMNKISELRKEFCDLMQKIKKVWY